MPFGSIGIIHCHRAISANSHLPAWDVANLLLYEAGLEAGWAEATIVCIASAAVGRGCRGCELLCTSLVDIDHAAAHTFVGGCWIVVARGDCSWYACIVASLLLEAFVQYPRPGFR